LCDTAAIIADARDCAHAFDLLQALQDGHLASSLTELVVQPYRSSPRSPNRTRSHPPAEIDAVRGTTRLRPLRLADHQGGC
ncbi:MAG TPA: hypothetical protein VJK02_12930, partial [Anaerolineales bacterium]|nr:hypothetical protein [Anaerolineales bacterium]